MKKISARKWGAFFAMMGMLILLSALGIWRTQRKEVRAGEEHSDGIVVYPQGGFYEKDVKVQITAPRGAVVCYTLNCEEPDRQRGQVYEAPILLAAGEAGAEQVYVLRTKVFYADGAESETETRTYFCGQGIKERYDDGTLVVSIAGGPEGLFGYEEGILVPGRRYDTFLEENPGAHPGGGVDANYTMRGRDAEREVSIEIFDPQGRGVIAQEGGVRVAGELSRLNNQKSLRLYARTEYARSYDTDGTLRDNKFRYDFFGDLYSMEDGTLGQAYKRLLLQNSGQDYGYGFVRTELVGRLADEAGFPDTQHVRPACVYINGDYYGSYWLSNSFDSQYFENRYGEQDGEFIVLEGGDRKKTAADETDALEVKRVEEFNARYDAFAEMDLTVEENYQALREFLDVENYLEYFAIENYVGNDDWPDANVKTYRYAAGAGGYGQGALDGRYRMLLFDADYGFGLLFYYDTVGCLVNEMTLDKIMYEKSPLFAALMRREDCRQYFVSCTLDLMNGVMKASHVAETLDALHGAHARELSRMLSAEGLVGGLLLEEDKLNMDTVEWNVQRIKVYAQERPEYVLQDIGEKFGYGQQYKLTVMSENETASVKVNSVYSDIQGQEFSGIYLKEVPVTLMPCLGPNDVFAGWLVDGVLWTEEKLVLGGMDLTEAEEDRIVGMSGSGSASGEFFVVYDETVRVELLTSPKPDSVLRIGAVAAKGREDYVELVNLSKKPISTRGYYLSDNEELYQYAVPVLTLEPGGSLRLVGKGNNSPDSLGQFALNFDLKEGEVLTLTRHTYIEEILDEVEIPDLSADGVYEKDFRRGIFVEHKRR